MISRTKLLICGAILLVIISALIYGLSNRYSNQTISQQQKDSVEGQIDQKNLRPSDRNNESKDSNQDQSNSKPSTVTPILSRWGAYDDGIEAAGYIQDVYEDEGICTYRFEQAGNIITEQTTGFKDATTTNCPGVLVDRSKFASSPLTVTLTYKSSTASGQSKVQKIEF